MRGRGTRGALPVLRGHQVWAALITVLLIALLTTVYYLVPVPGHLHEGSWIVLFCLGSGVLATMILVTVAGLLRAGPEVRVRSLVLLLCVAVLFFSWADVALARVPGEFVSLHTKTDSLYFSVSTLATVGFGDVHAQAQLARIAVTIEIVFNLVFLGTAITTLSGWIRSRASRIQASHTSQDGDS